MSAACRRGTSKEDEMTSHCLMWAGPLEDDDLLSEILLRLPPQPSSLLRASLVCKRWRHLISDCGFFHRFRLRHLRNPPLLGFFSLDRNLAFLPTLEAPNRVPPERFSLQSGDGHGDRFFSLGCRHGLVLISKVRAKQVLVWDPVTGNQHHLDIPRVLATHAKKTTINGAVFRATGDIQQFHVVLTVVDNSNKHKRALAWVDSSDTGLWGDPISTPVPSSVLMINDTTSVFTGKPAVLAGGCLYWILAGDFIGILEFELERQSLDVIRVPVHMLEEGHYLFLIMRAEGGGLGLLFQTNPGFQLWKRKTGCDGVASWGLGRIIELDKLLSSNGNEWQMILGFAEENNVVLVWIACVLLIYGLS